MFFFTSYIMFILEKFTIFFINVKSINKIEILLLLGFHLSLIQSTGGGGQNV